MSIRRGNTYSPQVNNRKWLVLGINAYLCESRNRFLWKCRTKRMDVPYDLNKVKKGDKNAFRSFFGYFYPKLMALACRFVDSQVAEDLVQDVFASYWEKKHLIEADDIHSFLFKWLQNSCLNHIKHQMVVQDYEERVRIAEARLEAMGKSEEQSEVLKHILSQDLRELVEKSISKLPPKMCRSFPPLLFC